MDNGFACEDKNTGAGIVYFKVPGMVPAPHTTANFRKVTWPDGTMLMEAWPQVGVAYDDSGPKPTGE